MRENRLEYRRNLSNREAWSDFSVQHTAFALHRITGWALLGWVVIHLGFPVMGSGSSVWNPLVELAAPVSKLVVVGLFAVLIFHVFNGIRLLAAELLGAGAGNTKGVFLFTLAVSSLLVVGMGVVL